MKLTYAFAAVFLLVTGTAFAETRCEKQSKIIDEALATKPKLTDAEMKEVKSLRSKAEQLCREKKFAEARDAFAQAKVLLGPAVQY